MRTNIYTVLSPNEAKFCVATIINNNGIEIITIHIGENSVDICLNNINCVQLCNEQAAERFRADLQQLVSTNAPVDMPPLMDVNTL